MPNRVNVTRTLDLSDSRFVGGNVTNQVVQRRRDVSQRSGKLLFCGGPLLECDDRLPTDAFYFAAAEAFVLMLLDTIQIGCDDLKLQAGTSGIEYKDVHAGLSLLGCIVPASLGALWFFGLGGNRHELFGVFVRVHGVLVCLFAQLVSGQMISLAMGGGGGSMGVSCQVVKFCEPIVRALWHGILLLNRMDCTGGADCHPIRLLLQVRDEQHLRIGMKCTVWVNPTRNVGHRGPNPLHCTR